MGFKQVMQEIRYKEKILQSVKDRLDQFGIEMPDKVVDILPLYFGTYPSHLDFWVDENRVFQRLDVYEDFILFDESTILYQSVYSYLKEGLK